MNRGVPAILCIGGLDPSGGAGLLADAAAVRERGGHALAVAVALTVQSRRGVRGAGAVSQTLWVAQIEELFAAESVQAVKLGMLRTGFVASRLTALLKARRSDAPLVIDPVLRATSGAALFQGRPAHSYRRLCPLATVATPNLAEAALLLGRPIGDARSEREAAAAALAQQLGCAIVLKGGHAAGSAADLVFTNGRPTWIEGPRFPSSRRGTGCRFAAALATGLARGEDLVTAARAAKLLVRAYLTTGR